MSEQEKEQPTEQQQSEENASVTYAGDVAEAEVIHADGTKS